jgi:hypothetical protein
MMRNLADLNINEGGQVVRRPKPTDKDIAAFERQIGHSLPPEYLQLLRFVNGGHPQLDSFVPKGADEDNKWAVNIFYNLGPDKNDIGGLWKAVEGWQKVLGKLRLPIACDSGGNQIVLNLRKEPATVELCIHDEGFHIVPVADSLEQFLDFLSVDPDMI